MTVVSNGIKVGDEGFEVSRRAPNVGEHTIEILTSFGCSPDAVADLTSRGVITQQMTLATTSGQRPLEARQAGALTRRPLDLRWFVDAFADRPGVGLERHPAHRAVARVSGFEAGVRPRGEALGAVHLDRRDEVGATIGDHGPERQRSGLRAGDGVVLSVGCFWRLTRGELTTELTRLN